VLVLSGADRGKTGRVLRVIPEKDRVVVEGVNIIKRHSRPTQKNPKGGIVEKEAAIHISNVKKQTT
jgi:large subunit ribosomal protein L24